MWGTPGANAEPQAANERVLGRDLASLDAARGAGGPDLAFFLSFFASVGTARVASSASVRTSGKKARIASEGSSSNFHKRKT